ncbi:hypothetical protein AU184_10365 [Mycolicibacterium novocastrense]|nr:hypothetical protein AU072_26495 [Mycolicibacterium novocastrense]KUH70505.1 hypothetical protein AU184_10365 [Mycolicibacterium novocastrense]KUH79113.1 hypothetical protein AU183_03915 [Mycolicibacterium novocastrense]
MVTAQRRFRRAPISDQCAIAGFRGDQPTAMRPRIARAASQPGRPETSGLNEFRRVSAVWPRITLHPPADINRIGAVLVRLLLDEHRRREPVVVSRTLVDVLRSRPPLTTSDLLAEDREPTCSKPGTEERIE